MGSLFKDKPLLRDRLIYLAVFIILLVAEILIGLYVHDSFIRPYFGDTLVVILLWALVRIIIPRKAVWLSGAVFAFAVLVELSQLIPLVDLLGIQNQLIRVLMGTSFAFGDILAYAAGCIITVAIDLLVLKKRKDSESNMSPGS
ncbi:MAG: DUF2809 domain-containing protein [Clostridia bacterium]|nr:DUF2809 domain-containing protein [Clostridia bacterium]